MQPPERRARVAGLLPGLLFLLLTGCAPDPAGPLAGPAPSSAGSSAPPISLPPPTPPPPDPPPAAGTAPAFRDGPLPTTPSTVHVPDPPLPPTTAPTPAALPPAAPPPTASPPTPTAPTPASPPPTTSPPPAPAPSAVAVSQGPIRPVTAADLGASWREGCPVPPERLRLLVVEHLGFDGAVHTGHLVVHEDWAEALLGVFAEIRAAGFPIERMVPVDAYGADDDRSMAANNTSAFNCRPVAGTNRWSEHSYGRAVDVNPLINPYVRGDVVSPPGGASYLSRDPSVPGLIVDGDAVVRAFAAIGWGWGGHWASAKDYQHFSSTGR